jgi:hypothetical protein
MSLSFKQFSAFQEAAARSDDDFLAHLEEGLFKSDNERVEQYKSLLASKDAKVRQAAERGLELLVKKGNAGAKALAAHMDKVKATRRAADDAKMKHAQATNQAADRGASAAYDAETGSIRRGTKGTTGTTGTLGSSNFNAHGKFQWNDGRYSR